MKKLIYKNLGVYAIISLMVKDIIETFEGKLYPHSSELLELNSTLKNSSILLNPMYLSNDPLQAKIMIGMSLSFYAGVIQVKK